MTTYISAKMFQDTYNVPNTQTIIIAQDSGSTELIFQMIKRFYDNLRPEQRRHAVYNSKNELYWQDIDSYIFAGTAGSKKIGRGGTINNVHCSEVPQWENAEEIIAGLLQSVPSDGNIFLEGTAKGIDNYFYNEYIEAMEHNSIYTARFFPWFLDHQYMAETLTPFREFVATEDELHLAQVYNLNEQQLIWRRNKIMELKRTAQSSDSPVGTFPQEYPSHPMEAFLTSGTSFFNKDQLFKLMELCPEPLDIAIPQQYSYLRRIEQREIKFTQLPVANHRYILTADPSEGLNNSGDHDYCSSDIIDVETWQQVGKLRGRWEPNEYAHILDELGRFYNYALIVVERNNHGHSVLNTLLNECEYVPEPQKDGWGGVYFHKEYDAKKKGEPDKPGFPTNVKTKALAASALWELVDDESITINSKQTLVEMGFYSKLPGGKLGALKGHDDSVSSMLLGAYVLRDTSFFERVEKKDSRRKKKVGKVLTKPSRGFM